MRHLILTVLFALLPLTAGAQDKPDILTLPEGQTLLHISATERQEVEQDLLVGSLSYQAKNRDARALQNEINNAMKRALDKAKKVKEVKVNTGAYQVYETTVPRTKERIWQGQQSLTLKSKNADDLLELAGDLQDMGLNMQGLSYTLDPETAVSIQDSLMEAALTQLQIRANRAAKALGKSSAELREVNVQGREPSYHSPMPRMAMMEMAVASDMAAPNASPGETTITLSVSAKALLKP